MGLGLDEEVSRMEDENDTARRSFIFPVLSSEQADLQVDSVMAKLAIERRVQYGAEKMLDVSSTRRRGCHTGHHADGAIGD
jgi:hypothetical protein